MQTAVLNWQIVTQIFDRPLKNVIFSYCAIEEIIGIPGCMYQNLHMHYMLHLVSPYWKHCLIFKVIYVTSYISSHTLMSSLNSFTLKSCTAFSDFGLPSRASSKTKMIQIQFSFELIFIIIPSYCLWLWRMIPVDNCFIM